MPNPTDYKISEKQKFMGDCMHQVKTEEGEPQEDAVAKCLGMWGSKGKKKKCASDVIRELADKLQSL